MTSCEKSGVLETPPRLHGDGVHDDTDAVNWYAAHGLPLPLGGRYVADPARLRLPQGIGLVALGDGYEVSPAPRQVAPPTVEPGNL
jgi:hypothetical protein